MEKGKKGFGGKMNNECHRSVCTLPICNTEKECKVKRKEKKEGRERKKNRGQ